MTTVETILNESTRRLKKAKIRSPRLDAEVLLSNLLDVPRINFIIDKDRQIEESTREIFESLIERRLQGEPVAYIIGQKEFMGLNFLVDRNVLIPRPDTEILVEYVINNCQDQEEINLLDMGTGSGAIGISIAKHKANVSLTLIDVSEESLNLAKRNAQRLGIKSNVEYILSDCFKNIGNRQFDKIVSNPPYIPTNDIMGLQTEIKNFEPLAALDGGSDGLDFYKTIIEEGKSYLKRDGLMALEIGYDQAESVIKMLKCNGYKRIEKLKDYGGRDRVIGARLQ